MCRRPGGVFKKPPVIPRVAGVFAGGNDLGRRVIIGAWERGPRATSIPGRRGLRGRQIRVVVSENHGGHAGAGRCAEKGHDVDGRARGSECKEKSKVRFIYFFCCFFFFRKDVNSSNIGDRFCHEFLSMNLDVFLCVFSVNLYLVLYSFFRFNHASSFLFLAVRSHTFIQLFLKT